MSQLFGYCVMLRKYLVMSRLDVLSKYVSWKKISSLFFLKFLNKYKKFNAMSREEKMP